MRIRSLPIAGLSIAASLLAAAPAHAAKNAVVELVSPGWRAGKMQRLPVDDVRRWGGDPAIEREYGVRFLEVQVFTQADETAEVVAERATDATSAYGLFTYYRSADMTPEAGMHYAVSGPEGALLFRSQIFIRAVLPPPPAVKVPPTSVRSLLAALGADSPLTEDMTALPTPLPSANLVAGSEKYLIGEEAARRILPAIPPDLFGFNLGAEVQTGEYAEGPSHSRVVVITYPTPQIAHSAYDRMQKRLDLNQAGSAAEMFGKQEGSFVVLVLNAESSAAAAHWMDLFQRRVVVSWDKPYQGDKPPLYQMLNFIVLNIIFVFYLCGWSVLGGVILFLSKQAARKWFPQTAYGQPDDARIITLKLS
jgi:uncharacterized protein DUF6599